MADAARHLLVDRPGRPSGASPKKAYLAISPRAAGPLPRRQGGQRLGVAQHGARLPEGAHQVLALGQVHAGLAADGRVDLGQQRGGDVHVGRAPVVGGGGEAGHVGDDAAADGHDHVGPGEPGWANCAAELLDRGQRLGVLAVGDDADLEGQAGVEAVEPARPR